MKKIEIRNYPMVNPTPIVLIGADVHGNPNYATVGAFGVVCCEPIFYISLKDTHYTTIGVKENGCFSVNLPSVHMLQKTDYCGTITGNQTNKSSLFTPFYDERAKAPMISESPMNYLCKVVNSVPINDFEVFFGEIVATFVNEECIENGLPDPQKVDPVLAMGLTYYSLGSPIGKIFQEGKTVI